MPEQSDKLSQGAAAYEKLYAAIREGALQPGERVREEDIAARFSLSRTPIREALRKLEAEGIVQHKPRIGAVIRRLSHTEVVELYEMRAVLERTAAQLAAKHASPGEIDEMEDLNSAIAASIDAPMQAAAINQSFHRCIYLATRNRFLLDAARSLNNALMLLGPTTLADKERITIVCQQHQDVIDAIRQGDVERAGACAEVHLQTSLRHRLKVMRP